MKSKYILDKIFLFLVEKKKLKIIIYKKYLQKSLDIKLENYKKVSGIYKIDGINGKGKEYSLNTNRLIFYGEYLNGRRNGKGEEYSNSKIHYKCFEGEYLNGKRNGKGKEYYEKKKLKFEGEYLNGKRNGKGKQYIENGKLLFEGEYLNNKRWNGNVYNPYRKIKFELKNGNGNIKEYYNNGKIQFEDEYLNGEKNGKGKENDRKGNLLFEGEYLNNKRWKGI